MFTRKIILILIVLFALCSSLTFVNASQDNMTHDEVIVDESVDIEYYAINEDVNFKNSSKGTFSDLNELIEKNNGEINLEKDYLYDNESDYVLNGDGILINKSVVINGNNHIIDGQNKSKIFNIKANNVTIKNITFLNGNANLNDNNETNNGIIIYAEYHIIQYGSSEYNAVSFDSKNFFDTRHAIKHSSSNGGAIYCSGNNLKIINSSFINNFASNGGGIYIKANNVELINLNFINNTASEDGGAIYNTGNNTFILQSQFNSNHANFSGDSICSYKDINIQKCNFTHSAESVIFCGGNWQLDNITSDYFNQFVKFGKLNFKFNLTHIHDDYYNLKITFGHRPSWVDDENWINDDIYGDAVNRLFYLNIDGEEYSLKTDANSQVDLNLNLTNSTHTIKVYNPITNLSLTKSFDLSEIFKPKKIKSTIIAKNKVFSKKAKTKLYSVILKDNNGYIIKKSKVSLKIKGKLFKAKTNNKGKATFKIRKLNKKGTYKAKVIFKGNKNYNSVSKKIIIKIK